jgi:hypothetical protein
VLTPDQKGSIAETAIIHEATKLGIGVLKPINDDLRYDLVLDDGEQLLRVQCKWAVRRRGVVVVWALSSRRTAVGYSRRPYTAEQVTA